MPSTIRSRAQDAGAYWVGLATVASLALIGACSDVDSDSPEEKRTAPPYYSSPEVTSIPIQGCPDAYTEVEPVEPELCPWLMSFDVIALATVESRTTGSTYAVETESARRIQQPVRKLGLEQQFPWLESAASADDPVTLVDSCPDGTSASVDGWRLNVIEVPSLIMGMRIDTVLWGAVPEASTNFHVGWEQRHYWNGPKPFDQGEWVGTQLAPGSVVGVPLTYDHSGEHLLLAGEQPFVIDADGYTRMNSIRCPPLVPKTFNGSTPAELTERVQECSADKSAVLAGQEMREERLRWVSAPLGFPPTANYCIISFHKP